MKKKFMFVLVGLMLVFLFGLTSDSHSITVDPIKIEALVGDKGTVKANIIEESLKNQVLEYTSEDSNIISIDAEGNWEAKAVGNTQLTVSLKSTPEPVTENISVKISSQKNNITGYSLTDVVPDPALKAAINQSLSRPDTTDITIEDLEGLTSLYLDGPYEINSTDPRITSLEGLQYATNLTDFSINFGDLSNPDSLAPISNLTSLKSLGLLFCYLTPDSLHHLVNLTNLDSLYLAYNRLDNLDGLEPLFEAKLQQFQNDPNTESFYFSANHNPTTDFSGVKPYFEYIKEWRIADGYPAEQAEVIAANSAMTSISPKPYEIMSMLDPNWETNIGWGMDFTPIKLPDIWSLRVNEASSQEKNRIPVKEAITDFNGEMAAFGVQYDWKEDITYSSLNFPMYIRIDNMFDLSNTITNGSNNLSPWTDTVEDYFTLETRDSFDYPGETEYYYKGRDYNIIPYNPHATGASDRQDTVLSPDGYILTYYYFEFKNFNDPVLLPGSTEFYYPNSFKNTADSTTITLASSPVLRESNIPIMNSLSNIVYEQVINWINPEPPVLNGLTNISITAGTAFDPLAGITASDPTQDGDNPDGTTPKDITSSIVIVSGSVDINTPGTYKISYKVVSPYGLEATGERTITVVANGGSGTTTGGGGTLPSTGNMPFLILGLTLLSSGALVLLKRKINN